MCSTKLLTRGVEARPTNITAYYLLFVGMGGLFRVLFIIDGSPTELLRAAAVQYQWLLKQQLQISITNIRHLLFTVQMEIWPIIQV
jgi:hypothetical protein